MVKIGNFLNKNSLIIVDDNVKNFNLIFEDYKKILNFIVISNKKYDDVILNLNEKDSFELLFQQIKTYLKNINQ